VEAQTKGNLSVGWSLQHGFVWTLTPLYATFDSWESAKSFSIAYTIHAGNMIDDQTGELGVVIKRI
jgi:hypothetical protein